MYNYCHVYHHSFKVHNIDLQSVSVCRTELIAAWFYFFNFKMYLFNFENYICTLSVCIGHGSRSRGPTMTKCRVTQPHPKQLQIQFNKSSRMDFQNSNFQMQSFSVGLRVKWWFFETMGERQNCTPLLPPDSFLRVDSYYSESFEFLCPSSQAYRCSNLK